MGSPAYTANGVGAGNLGGREVKLPNERYEYLYVADDGVWLEDPEAAASVSPIHLADATL